jgi:hypothetical protein
VRESKERNIESFFFFWLSDFYLFFTISRKFKNIKGIGKKGTFTCFAFPTARSTRIVGSPDD